MIINHNMASLNTYRQLSANNANTGKSLEKLSSGLRINRAGDDAAGLAISEKMRGQIRGLDQAARNSQDAISLIQTAEGALNETHSILQRMRELSVQSASDTATSTDRAEIQKEVDELAKEITRISNTTEFNTKNLLAGGLNSTFHIGANANQNIALSVNAMDAFTLGVAGSTVTTNSFVANTSGATGVSNAGRGLATGNDYHVQVTKTDANLANAMAKASGSGTGDESNATIDDITDFTGVTNTAYRIEVAGLTGNDATSIRYSTDGGTTWTLVNGVDDDANDQWQFSIGNGLTLNLADGGAADVYATDDEFTFTAGRASAAIVLTDSVGAQVGGTTTVYANSTSATLGDAATSKTVQLNYTFASLATTGAAAGRASFNVVSSASTAATVVNDVVTVNADTKAGIDVSTQAAANTAITSINTAIQTVSAERSKLGAYQNRLEHTISNLGTSSENMTAAESRVRDVDMAKEMMNFQKNNILSQAAQAMMAQANQQPQGVLQLLR